MDQVGVSMPAYYSEELSNALQSSAGVTETDARNLVIAWNDQATIHTYQNFDKYVAQLAAKEQ